jgi:exopolysaccharide biosynthesis operon protein EpsL
LTLLARPSRGLAAPLAAVLLAPATQALALDGDRVLLRGLASATYNSNVLGLSDQLSPAVANLFTGGRSEGDMIWGIGAGLSLNLPVSRQRIRFDGTATGYSYSNYDELNYTGYGVRAAWDWVAGNRWHGTAAAGAQKTRQGYTSAVIAQVPRLQTYYDGLIDARFDLTPHWELQAAGSVSQTKFDAQVFQVDDFDYQSGTLGARYRSSRGNATGAQLKYEQGQWPNRPPAPVASFDNEYSQWTLSAVLDWRVTGQSRLFGTAGYTSRAQDISTGESLSGPSGRLTYEYTFTGKSMASASIYQTLGPYQDNNATYIRTTGIDFAYVYQASAKLGLRASASFYEQDYLGASLAPGVQERQDDFTVLGLTGLWQITRVLSLTASAAYNDRTSNVPFGDFDQYIVSLTAQVQF